jgi:nucleoside-diphosphate-sugar epimerase
MQLLANRKQNLVFTPRLIVSLFATGVTGTIGKHIANQVKQINLDLRIPKELTNLPKFSQNDSLLHLAGVVGAHNVSSDPDKAYDVNVLATLRLAEKFFVNGGGRFIFISSSHVYAPSVSILNEESKTDPQSEYAQQKLDTEIKLMEKFDKTGNQICIVRVFSILDWDVPAFTLGGAIRKLSDPNSYSILRNVNDVRDFLTPKTVGQALLRIAQERELPSKLNLCSGKGISVLEAAREMIKKMGGVIPSGRIELGVSDNPYIVGDNHRLKSIFPELELTWNPTAN